MAKEKDKVKNGFAFYLFVLVMLIITAIFVVIMIMILQPELEILSFKYFNGNINEPVKEFVVGENKYPVNFDELKSVRVETNYANVNIMKSNTSDQDTLQIIDNAKGFARSWDTTLFEYKLSYSDSYKSLTITLVEPTGFLFFSSDIQINFILKKSSTVNFSNTKFEIKTDKGSVQVGNNVDESFNGSYNLNVKNLDVETNTGNLTLTKANGTTTISQVTEKPGEQPKTIKTSVHAMNNLSFTTNSGNLKCDIDTFEASNLKLSVRQNGNLSFITLRKNDKVELDMERGNFTASIIERDPYNYGTLSLHNFKNGNIKVDILNNIDSSGCRDDFEGGSISIIAVGGNVAIPHGGKANINIGKLSGTGFLRTTSGNITIEKAVLNVDVHTQTGNISVGIDDEEKATNDQHGIYLYEVNHSYRAFASESGNISLTFTGAVLSQNNITTGGNVSVGIQPNSHFLLKLANKSGEPVKSLGGNYTIENMRDDVYAASWDEELGGCKINKETAGTPKYDYTTRIIDITSGSANIYIQKKPSAN